MQYGVYLFYKFIIIILKKNKNNKQWNVRYIKEVRRKCMIWKSYNIVLCRKYNEIDKLSYVK